MALIELKDVKSQLRIPPSDTSSDVVLQGFVSAAVEAVERHTGVWVEQREATEVVHANGGPVLVVSRQPVVSIESVERLDGSRSWDGAGMVGDGTLIYLGAARVWGTVRVTYTAGLAAGDAPASYAPAAAIIVQHLWETRRGTAGVLAGGDGLDDSLAITGLGFAIPNRALELLGPPAAGVA